MKTKILLSVLAFGINVCVLGQRPTIELTFTAADNGQYVPLDSIFIENLTQSGDTTLYSPDTVLVLDYVTSIGDNEAIGENTLSVSPNYPNPFTGKTEFNLDLPEKENIKIAGRDILGRELVHYENILNRGNHTFSFYAGGESFYLLTVTGNKTSRSIKMLNAGNITSNGEKCKLVYTGYNENVSCYKSQKALNDFVFSLGNELQYTGYAKTMDGIAGNAVIDDSPTTNTNYEFAIIKGLRCPGNPTITDIDGNVYNTVQIGSQCWMAENLKTTTYSNGTLIPNVMDANAWSNLTTGAYVWYGNDISWKDKYGALYNWYTTVDPNGLCPTGWHVPTNDEWTALTDYIGGTNSPHGNELKSCRQVNSPMGGDCNTTEHPRWNEHNTQYGTDTYGFSTLPGGYRHFNGPFYSIGEFGYWWSSLEFSTFLAWFRCLYYDYGSVFESYGYDKQGGFSVRCLRD
jgi:uncharacterized protein (TIGR02145 family)